MLSHDDELQGKSNSISNQKAMLESYTEKNGFTGIRHFTNHGLCEGHQQENQVNI